MLFLPKASQASLASSFIACGSAMKWGLGSSLLVVFGRSSSTVSRCVVTLLQYRVCRLTYAFVIPLIKPTNVHSFTSTAAFIAIFISSHRPPAAARVGTITVLSRRPNLLRFQFVMSICICCLWLKSQLPLPSVERRLCIAAVRFRASLLPSDVPDVYMRK